MNDDPRFWITAVAFGVWLLIRLRVRRFIKSGRAAEVSRRMSTRRVVVVEEGKAREL